MYKTLKELGEEIVEGTIKSAEMFSCDTPSSTTAFIGAQKSVENKVMLGVLVEIRDELYALNQRFAAQHIIKTAKKAKK